MLDSEIARTGDLSDEAMKRRARAVRIALTDMTQEALAERLQVSLGVVKTWESRKGNGIRARHAAMLSNLADIRSDFILSGDLRETTIRREAWERVRAVLLAELGPQA